MVIDYYALASYFIIYSFVGWLVEVIFQAVTKGKIVNRGFLNGPVCPIYGFGMVAVLLFFNHINVGNLQEASYSIQNCGITVKKSSIYMVISV